LFEVTLFNLSFRTLKKTKANGELNRLALVSAVTGSNERLPLFHLSSAGGRDLSSNTRGQVDWVKCARNMPENAQKFE